MASVREVYNALRDIANKEQRGFVTPTEFNAFAPIAQTNIFNRMFTKLVQSENLRRRGIDPGRDKATAKQIKEDLSIFSKTVRLERDATTNRFSKPDDLAKIISMSTPGRVLYGTSVAKPIHIEYDEDKFHYLMGSTLSKPTTENPIAFLGEQDHTASISEQAIEIYPTTLRVIDIRYYKQPEGLTPADGRRNASLPKFGFTTSNNKEVYSSSASIDFELPEHYVPELIEEMARLIGVNLRDTSIYNFAEREIQKRG